MSLRKFTAAVVGMATVATWAWAGSCNDCNTDRERGYRQCQSVHKSGPELDRCIERVTQEFLSCSKGWR